MCVRVNLGLSVCVKIDVAPHSRSFLSNSRSLLSYSVSLLCHSGSKSLSPKALPHVLIY